MTPFIDLVKQYARNLYSFAFCSQPLPESGADIPTRGTGGVQPPRLPVEVTERISDFLFESQPPQLDSEDTGELISIKPAWDSVRGFMWASIDLHKMGYMRWVQIVTVKVPSDWARLLPDAHLIRYELVSRNCTDT